MRLLGFFDHSWAARGRPTISFWPPTSRQKGLWSAKLERLELNNLVLEPLDLILEPPGIHFDPSGTCFGASRYQFLSDTPDNQSLYAGYQNTYRLSAIRARRNARSDSPRVVKKVSILCLQHAPTLFPRSFFFSACPYLFKDVLRLVL